jgi:hypothetical protein
LARKFGPKEIVIERTASVMIAVHGVTGRAFIGTLTIAGAKRRLSRAESDAEALALLLALG